MEKANIAKTGELLSERVTLNVSGTCFEVDVDDIRRAPSSKLYRHVISQKGSSLYYNRPVQSFEAVLAYYQTGTLHMPMTLCPGAFREELKYWEIDPQIMSKCCYYRFLSHQDDQETLDKFHEHLFPNLINPKKSRTVLKNIRSKLWKIVDNVDSSVPTKIYFVMNMLFVILSVMTLALSTLPYFRRTLTKCEYELALGKAVKAVNDTLLLNGTCDKPLSDEEIESLFTDYETLDDPEESNTERQAIISTSTPEPTTPRRSLATFKRTWSPQFASSSRTTTGNTPVPSGKTNLTGPPGTNGTFQIPMLRNFFPKMDQADVDDRSFFEHIGEELKPKMGLKKKTVRIYSLEYIDFCLLIFFTVDLLVRLCCCPSIRRFFLSTINVIDALVVVAAYAHLAVNIVDEKQKYETTSWDLLEVFQVMRAVRLVRVAHNVLGFKVLTFCLKVSCQDLMVLFLYILIAVLIFANFVFFVESDANIDSIPVGWWWAINTLTTVGFGDVVPVSLYGRLIGAVCAVFGVLMMSVAIPVFVRTFMLLYQYAALYRKVLSKPLETQIYIYKQATAKMYQPDPTGNGEKAE